MKQKNIINIKRAAFILVGITLSFFLLKTNTLEAYVYIKLAINEDLTSIEDSRIIQRRLVANKVLKELEGKSGIPDLTKILGDRESGGNGWLNVFTDARTERLIDVHLTLPTRNKNHLIKALGIISKDYIIDYENKFIESEILATRERLAESREAYKRLLSLIEKNNINSNDLNTKYNSFVVFNQLGMIKNDIENLQNSVALFDRSKAEQIGDVVIIDRSDLLAITKFLILGILIGLIFEYIFEMARRSLGLI